MGGIGTLYIPDGPRIYRINHIDGRLILDRRGIQTVVDSFEKSSDVSESVFGLSVLSDDSSLKNENGGDA